MGSHLCDVVAHVHTLQINRITPGLFNRWDSSPPESHARPLRPSSVPLSPPPFILQRPSPPIVILLSAHLTQIPVCIILCLNLYNLFSFISPLSYSLLISILLPHYLPSLTHSRTLSNPPFLPPSTGASFPFPLQVPYFCVSLFPPGSPLTSSYHCCLALMRPVFAQPVLLLSPSPVSYLSQRRQFGCRSTDNPSCLP